MKRFSLKLEFLLSIPKSFIVCLKLMGLKKAFRLPIMVRYNTKILSLNGKIRCIGNGKIRVGFGKISEFDKKYQRSIIKLNGDITIDTPCYFGQGTRIISERDSKLYIGKNFQNTACLTISNRGYIEIGNDCLVSWNTWICDSDFHMIQDIKTGEMSQPDGYVKIGNHVWICANNSILKGSIIPDNCIIGAHSLVKGRFSDSNSIIAGSPAKIIKKDIQWFL